MLLGYSLSDCEIHGDAEATWAFFVKLVYHIDASAALDIIKKIYSTLRLDVPPQACTRNSLSQEITQLIHISTRHDLSTILQELLLLAHTSQYT